MKAIDVINNPDINVPDKIKILIQENVEKNKNLLEYIEYYAGRQDIKDRVHPKDPAKEINKICVNLYKKITDTASYFLFGESPKLILENNEGNNSELFSLFNESYNDADTDEINDKIGKETLAYGQSAELLYKKDGSVKYQFLSVRNNKLYPLFDEKGDMDAFIRSYNMNEYTTDGKPVTVKYYEVYTEKEMFKYKKDGTEYIQVKQENEKGENVPILKYEKIPIVYYSMEIPLAWDVKGLLDRINTIKSVHGDTNDYFGFPDLLLIGDPVTEDAEDGDKDKSKITKQTPNVLHMENTTEDGEKIQADARYLVWLTKPESAIYEMESLQSDALYITSTPNLSFDNLKGLGSVSGVALKLMFTDAIAQSLSQKNLFFSLSRRINIHKQLLSETSSPKKDFTKLKINVEFLSPIPKNFKELIDNLVNATISGIMSKETAIGVNPYVENNEIEKDLIKKEAVIGESFDIPEDE